MPRTRVCVGHLGPILGLLALVACKPGDLPPGGATGAPSDTEASETGQAGPFTDGPDGTGVTFGGSAEIATTVSALSAFFVESFEAFEERARQLREDDPRYRLQDQNWRIGGDATLRHSNPLAAIRAEYAHAAGLTGAGQVISVVDSGFLASHESIDGRIAYFADAGVGASRHGTAVASVAAGNADGMIGVAPGASLALGTYLSTESLAAATRDAARLGAVVQNNSWGYSIDVSRENYEALFPDNSPYLAALEEFTERGVVVFAASNDRTRRHASIMDGLPHVRPDLERNWLAVVNAVPDFDSDRIRSAELLSAGCNEAARWCLAADGAWTSASASATDAYEFATGTSFAAPQVSGAMALLAEAFPTLTPRDLRARLLASADNGFFEHDGQLEIAPGVFHGYARDFGHGFLDIRAALLPISGTSADLPGGGTVATDTPVVVAASAMGDAVARALGGAEILVSDALGGDFTMPAGGIAARRDPAPLLRGGFSRDIGAGLDDLPGRRATLASRSGDLSLDLVGGGPGGGYGIGLTADLTEGQGRLALGLKLIRDGSGLLGLTGAQGGADTRAAALTLATRAQSAAGGFFSFGAEIGMAEGADTGLVRAGATRFAALGLRLGQEAVLRKGDSFSLGVSLPRAITSGEGQLTLPVARSADGVEFDQVSFGLAPKAREIRLSAGYETPFAGGWTLRAEAAHAVNHGHVAGRRATGARLSLDLRF